MGSSRFSCTSSHFYHFTLPHAGERQLTATNSEEPCLRYVIAWLCEDHVFSWTMYWVICSMVSAIWFITSEESLWWHWHQTGSVWNPNNGALWSFTRVISMVCCIFFWMNQNTSLTTTSSLGWSMVQGLHLDHPLSGMISLIIFQGSIKITQECTQ